MSSRVVRGLGKLGVTVFGAWSGVLVFLILFSVFDANRLHWFGDKGPILFPILVGAPVGSLSSIFLLNKKESVRFKRAIWGFAITILGPLLGVVLALVALEVLGGVMLVAFPFIVSICSYGLYLTAIYLIGTTHNSNLSASNMTPL
jgi:hypothetical protein